MVITLLGNSIVKSGEEDAEARLTEMPDPILKSMPGSISPSPDGHRKSVGLEPRCTRTGLANVKH